MLGLSMLLGLAAVWVPGEFFDSPFAAKTLWTSVVLFGVSLAAAAITKWLG